MEIIYSDPDIIVVNKPPGIAIHPGGSVLGRTLTDELLLQFPDIAGVGEDPARPGIVHRLDRDTSGVMVVARRPESFAALKELFQKRLVEKTYLAIVCGAPRAREGVIDLPIGRRVSNPTIRGVLYRDPIPGNTDRIPVRGARDAVTHYRILKIGAGMALVELRPRTGRMHQLRVHLKAIGHPVACDAKYGGRNVCCPILKQGFQTGTPFQAASVFGASEEIEGADAGALPPRPRQLLHAQVISFAYPEGHRRFFEADPPEDFALALKALF